MDILIFASIPNTTKAVIYMPFLKEKYFKNIKEIHTYL